MKHGAWSIFLVCTACIVPAPSSQKAPQQQQQQRAAAPAQPIEVRNGAIFENKIELVGASLSAGRAKPGDSIRVAAIFKVKEAVPVDYMIFVHIEDVDGRVDRFQSDHAPVRGTQPTSKWKVGETIRDEFTIDVPTGAQVRGLNVLIGFWDPKSDQRLKLTNTEAVRHDGNNRILLAQIPLDQS